MARVTVEDCIDKVENRFDLVLLASHRARMISSGSQITIDRDNDKNPVVSLREIAEKTISPEDLKEDLIHSLQKYVEVDEPEAETVPLIAGVRRLGRCRRHRGRGRAHERGRAAQGPGRAGAARGAAGTGRGIAPRSADLAPAARRWPGRCRFVNRSVRRSALRRRRIPVISLRSAADRRAKRPSSGCGRRQVMARSKTDLPRMQNPARQPGAARARLERRRASRWQG